MKVKITSSKTVKPAYDGGVAAPSTDESVPLNVFDKVTYDVHIAVIYAFRPPNPPNAELEQGLARALAVYRDWAGRLGDGPDGRPAVLLNDGGAWFVEATVDAPLARSMPFKPSPELLRLHPSIDGPIEELVQVQLTRFACGSLVVGFTAHHHVADGQATGNFLVAWGLASRRLPVEPLPVRDRATRFQPRDQPLVEFPHRDTEYHRLAKNRGEEEDDDDIIGGVAHDKIKVHKVLFTKEFVARLKARASSAAIPPPTAAQRSGYSTFESLVGHLWRAVTAARGLGAGETTKLRISVNGRARMRPPVPREYFGNMVLWAFPRSDAGDLVLRPVQHAADLIHRAVSRVDDAYFRSFIDFAASGAVEAEGLATTADESQVVLCPDVEVDSWLGINFYDLDFGGGCPFYFMPSYLPMEGTLFLLPSFLGDGGIEAYVSLFEGHLEEFKRICYNILLAVRAEDEDDDEDELGAQGGGGVGGGAALGGGDDCRERAGAGAWRDDLRRLGGGRRQQQPAGHAGARRLPALRPRLPGHARAHGALLQRQARHGLHRGEPGAELVPAGVPERGGAEQQQEPPPRRQLRIRRRRLPRRHRRTLRRHLAEPAGGVLPGVPVARGGVGRSAAGQGADVRVHLRGERRHQRLRAELLREPGDERRLHARPVRRRAHAALHLLRRGLVQPGRPPDRRDVAAADGVPPGVRHPVRRRRRRWRLRGAPQQRLPHLQPEARRGRGRREAAALGPQARRLRHLPTAPRPRQQPHKRWLLRVTAGVLRDGHDRDVGAVPPGRAGDVHQRHRLRLLGRLPPHGRRQQGARRRTAPPGPAAHRVTSNTLQFQFPPPLRPTTTN